MPDALIDAPAPLFLMTWTGMGINEGPVSLWIHKGGGRYRDDANLSHATEAELRHMYGEDRVRPMKFDDAE